jgi:excisionase family DNA binding protein
VVAEHRQHGEVAPAVARLLDLEGISVWTTRELIARGIIRPVRVPGLRRLLIDRAALDELITQWAGGPS